MQKIEIGRNKEYTKLQYVKSKNAETIVEYVASLPFMIEIKSAPCVKGEYFYLFFILPNDFSGPITVGNLDD